MKNVEMEVVPYFGSFILETLTLGMYQESRNALREYVQNSYDSIMAAREEKVLGKRDGTIGVIMEPTRVVIADDGMGMSQDTAVEYLTSIGASQKDFRRQAGFRGIGRLAGMVMCDELVFVTKAAGEARETRVVFDAAMIRNEMTPAKARKWSLSDLLKKAVSASQSPAQRELHYFQVELNGLFEPPVECLHAADMVDFLSQVSPVDYSEDFPFADDVRREAIRRERKLDCVTVLVETDEEEIAVRKPYGSTYVVGKEGVELTEIEFRESPKE